MSRSGNETEQCVVSDFQVDSLKKKGHMSLPLPLFLTYRCDGWSSWSCLGPRGDSEDATQILGWSSNRTLVLR